MKLYFGNAVTTATTLMILALLECLRIIGGETENLSYGAEGPSRGVEAEQSYLREQEDSVNNVQYVARSGGEIIGTASAMMEAILAFARENGFEQLRNL